MPGLSLVLLAVQAPVGAGTAATIDAEEIEALLEKDGGREVDRIPGIVDAAARTDDDRLVTVAAHHETGGVDTAGAEVAAAAGLAIAAMAAAVLPSPSLNC